MKHSLDMLPVHRKACSSECFCFLVFVLKFGQPQSHTSNFDNIKTILSYFAFEKVSELVELGKNSHSTYEDLVERADVTYQKSRNPG